MRTEKGVCFLKLFQSQFSQYRASKYMYKQLPQESVLQETGQANDTFKFKILYLPCFPAFSPFDPVIECYCIKCARIKLTAQRSALSRKITLHPSPSQGRLFQVSLCRLLGKLLS